MFVAQPLQQQGQQRTPWLRMQPQGGDNGGGQQRRVGERSQFNQPDAIGKGRQQRGGNFERQPRLAGAAGADQRHEARGGGDDGCA